MLATVILGKISVTRTRTVGRGEEPLLSSRWAWIGSELSSPNFNSSVRAERPFVIHYLNIEIKPLCGNFDIFLTTRLTLPFGWRASVVDRGRKRKMLLWIALFGHALAQFNRFRDRNPFQSQKNPSTRMHLMLFGSSDYFLFDDV